MARVILDAASCCVPAFLATRQAHSSASTHGFWSSSSPFGCQGATGTANVVYTRCGPVVAQRKSDHPLRPFHSTLPARQLQRCAKESTCGGIHREMGKSTQSDSPPENATIRGSRFPSRPAPTAYIETARPSSAAGLTPNLTFTEGRTPPT